MDFPVKVILPFLLMFIFSHIFKRNSDAGLKKYFAKMATPVSGTEEQDIANIAHNIKHYELIEKNKIFPGSDIEIQKFTKLDINGFVIIVIVCIAVIGLLQWIMTLGA
jgi:hypothetical protein